MGPALHFWYGTLARVISQAGTQGSRLNFRDIASVVNNFTNGIGAHTGIEDSCIPLSGVCQIDISLLELICRVHQSYQLCFCSVSWE